MNPNNFLSTTDYPIDQILGAIEGSFTVAGTSFISVSVPHGLSFEPLGMLKWSTDPTFDLSYDEIGISFNAATVTMSTDATNVNFDVLNLTQSSITVYYRVIFYAKPNENVTTPASASELDSFALSTDYNNPKIFLQGSAAPNDTVTHGLGYLPQMDLWYRTTTGVIFRFKDATLFNSPDRPRAQISTSSLQLYDSDFGYRVQEWYYRIYVDEI